MTALTAVLTAAVVLRICKLDHLPGLNGDEAWYGAWAVDLLAGREVPWRTPTGNPVNPFFHGPQTALHLCFAPSVTVLRSVAAASGLLALLVNFFLSRRTLGGTAAWFSTLMLAALPINIAYSRFAWDACQTVLAVVLVVHAALLMLRPQSGKWSLLAAIMALAAACLVHPTNVFVAPLPLAAVGYRWRHMVTSWLKTRRRAGLLAVAAALAIVAAGLFFPGLGRLASRAALRSVAPEQYVLFGRNALRLFAGTAVYRYVAGSPLPVDSAAANSLTDWDARDAAALLLLVGVAIAWRRGRRSADATTGVLGYGGAATALGFFLVAGPESIEPHYERYGLCLIAPGVLWLSTILARMADRNAGWRRCVWTAVLLLCAALELDFQENYVRFLEQTGGRSHLTFRTAEVDPKLAAVQAAVAAAPDNQRLTIVASAWWTYWPARYFTADLPQVAVRLDDRAGQGREAPPDELVPGQVAYIEFTEDPSCAARRRQFAERGRAFDEQQFLDFAGRPTVSLLRPLAGP